MKRAWLALLLIASLCPAAMAQSNLGTSPLPGNKGGTNNKFMQFTGPATSIKTYALPNASDTIATIAAAQALTNKTFDCANNTCTVRIASDVTGIASGCVTFLVTPSSANLRGCLTDEVGTGAFYTVGGALGTPASGTGTNFTGIPLSGLVSQAAWSFVVNNTSGSAAPTAVDIASLTTKASPAAGDYVVLSDQAASGALKKATVSSVGSAGSVSSLDGATGAFTFGYGLTRSSNDLRINFSKFEDRLLADSSALTTSYAIGPSVSQGGTGVFFATGKATFIDTGAAQTVKCILWDGTSAAIDSGSSTSGAANFVGVVHLAGFATNPAGNLRISCKNTSGSNTKMVFNSSGDGFDTSIRVVRIGP